MFEAFRVAAKGGGYVLDVVDAFVTILKIARLTTDGLALGFNLVAMSVDQVALSIDRVLGADTAENLKRRQEVITGTVAAGMARLATSWESTVAAFNAPLPHENVDKFFDDVQKKSAGDPRRSLPGPPLLAAGAAARRWRRLPKARQ
jgi:hypothetical protein